jgi:hypothetical protein
MTNTHPVHVAQTVDEPVEIPPHHFGAEHAVRRRRPLDRPVDVGPIPFEPARVEQAGLVVDPGVASEDLEDLGGASVLEVLERPSGEPGLATVLVVLLGHARDAGTGPAPRKGACSRFAASSRSDTKDGER